MIRYIVEEKARNEAYGIIHKNIINQRRRVIDNPSLGLLIKEMRD